VDAEVREFNDHPQGPTMKFTKMQGTGNDFLFVETGDDPRDWDALARAMCDRYFGAGADGLMLVMPSRTADVRMRLFNADGSEAEVSGNGVRCLVKYVVERGLALPKDGRVVVEAVSGPLVAEVTGDSRVESVRLSMGAPRFEPAQVPVTTDLSPPVVDMPLEAAGRSLALTCLSMGNPHAVAFVDAPVEEYPLDQIGPAVENHAAFPARVNFGVARVRSPQRMDVRVWERGVGETLACGSGSCAAMVAARLHGRAGDRVDIKQPGGSLVVEWDGEGDVYLSGPAEFVYEGEWPE
jgi:diaminopimelate epimerase